MAKNNNAIYAPGELSQIRGKLGVTDAAEAKRMALLLGGEVGTERTLENDKKKNKNDTTGGKKRRTMDMFQDEDLDDMSKSKRSGSYPGDDPSITVSLSYGERVKIDQYASQLVFEIKSPMQVFSSLLSFFRRPVDYVNPRFVVNRMNEYYNKIEKLVHAARTLFPKSNKKRDSQLKRTSFFVYKIQNILRSWDIETLGKNISELQAHPRAIKVTDFSDILRIIYKPIFLLDELNIEDIKSAFKLIYKILYIESPMEAKEKYQDIIRDIIASLTDIRKNVRFCLYPMLMKLISDRYIIYERFFIERRMRFMSFLNVKETDQLNVENLNSQQIESMDVDTLQKNLSDEVLIDDEALIDDENEIIEGDSKTQEEGQKEDSNDPEVIKKKAKEEAEKTEQKAMKQGLSVVEILFPKAGWDKLEEYPDFYPYFANVYDMKQGFELIAPTDPLQCISVLLHILDDLFTGLRYVNFSTITGADGTYINISNELTDILNNWHSHIENSFSRDYLPRLTGYCRLLENLGDSRTSPYAKKILNELHWIKRLYFLPYYKFESLGPPPFSKSDTIPIYSDVRKLRRYLTGVAFGIEHGVHAGGAAAKAPCNGINNPWEHYNFQVPNPVSRRLNIMLPPEKRMNATLIFFSLSSVTILDHIVNNENCWIYNDKPGPLFRSVNNDGITPLFGVDKKLDADKIFRDSLKKAGA